MGGNNDDMIYKRCEQAMLANQKYQDLQTQLIQASAKNDTIKYEEISADLHILSAKICYIACAIDLIGQF